MTTMMSMILMRAIAMAPPGGVEAAAVPAARAALASAAAPASADTVAGCWRAGCSRWAVWYSEHVRLNAQVVELTGAKPAAASSRLGGAPLTSSHHAARMPDELLLDAS